MITCYVSDLCGFSPSRWGSIRYPWGSVRYSWGVRKMPPWGSGPMVPNGGELRITDHGRSEPTKLNISPHSPSLTLISKNMKSILDSATLGSCPSFQTVKLQNSRNDLKARKNIKYIETPCEALPTRLSQLQTSIIIWYVYLRSQPNL